MTNRELYAESMLAVAQSELQRAVNNTDHDVRAAGRLLEGGHDLTIREMAGALWGCGFRLVIEGRESEE